MTAKNEDSVSTTLSDIRGSSNKPQSAALPQESDNGIKSYAQSKQHEAFWLNPPQAVTY